MKAVKREKPFGSYRGTLVKTTPPAGSTEALTWSQLPIRWLEGSTHDTSPVKGA